MSSSHLKSMICVKSGWEANATRTVSVSGSPGPSGASLSAADSAGSDASGADDCASLGLGEVAGPLQAAARMATSTRTTDRRSFIP